MPLLDFDTLVICNNNYSENELLETFEFFLNYGVKKFIVLSEADPSDSSVAYITDRYASLKTLVKSLKLKCDINVSYNLHMSPSVVKNPILKKLKYKRSDNIFVEIPIFTDREWFMPDINYLLYRQKCLPIFTSFEKNFISCDTDMINQTFRIKNAVFCLDINYITSLDGEMRIRQGMGRNTLIVPCITNDLHSYAGVISRFEMLKQRLGTNTYLRFCKYLNDSIKGVF